MILKAILCVQHFCSLGGILFIVNLFLETHLTVICVACMLEHVWTRFINNWEESGVLPIGLSSFGLKLSLLASVILHMICYRPFSLWFGFMNNCSFFGTNATNHVVYRTPNGKYIRLVSVVFCFSLLMF